MSPAPPIPDDRAPPEALVIGVSAGGMYALERLLPHLPARLAAAVIIVQHLHPSEDGYLAEHLGRFCALPVAVAEDKAPIRAATVTLAPAGYHLLVERSRTFALSIDARVCFARPSIDVLFESAARTWGAALWGLLLTGANEDGTRGLAAIHALGGWTIAQDPADAAHPAMPRSAIVAGVVRQILTLDAIGTLLAALPPAAPSVEPKANR